MKTIVLVGCGKDKLDRPAEAKDLYTGTLFRKARAYAERFGDEWGILSAKHNLLMPDDFVEPYDLSLMDLSAPEQRSWGARTNIHLRARWPCAFFVCLAGELYGQAFEAPLKLSVEFPMAGLGLGKRLRYLNEALKRREAWTSTFPLTHTRPSRSAERSLLSFMRRSPIGGSTSRASSS